MTPDRPNTKDRDSVLAEMAARRAALDALDAAALADVSGYKEQIADAGRTVQRLAHRIADEERQLREARARIAVARDAIRSELGRFVAAGAQSAAVATLHGVPSSWVEPREGGLGEDGEEDGGSPAPLSADELAQIAIKVEVVDDDRPDATSGDSWAAPEPAGHATADLYAVAANEPDEAQGSER
jgi:hypothetical protein